MTIFAIRLLSSCVKALGVFEVLRSGRLGEPQSDESCGSSQLGTLIQSDVAQYLDVACFSLAVEVIIRPILHKDAATEVVKCCLLVTFEHCPRKAEHICSDLMILVPVRSVMCLTDQLELLLNIVK